MVWPIKKLFLKLVKMFVPEIMKKLLLTGLFAILTTAIFAQEATKSSKGRPNIPGTLQLDLGINRMIDAPNNLKIGLWGSRTLNLYYFYDVRIGDSKFSLHPGLGFGFERFKLIDFDKRWSTDTVKRATPTFIVNSAGNTILQQAARTVYAPADTVSGIQKSMAIMNYIDVPLEVRFSTNPYDPSRSFKVSIGGRVGYLIGAHTKLKYEKNGETRLLKDNQNYNLNPFRYSATLRIGIGNFNWFAHYNLNTLFEKDKGPERVNTNTYTVGISLAGF